MCGPRSSPGGTCARTSALPGRQKGEWELEIDMRRGFTLIELLIVVAIIGILAAVAILNFLEAQVRAKLARERAELRTFATTLEIYRLDHNEYPPYGVGPVYNEFGIDPAICEPHWLSTPIAYVSNPIFFDPFRLGRGYSEEEMLYNYVNWEAVVRIEPSYDWIYQLYGAWRLSGCGPDGLYNNADLEGTVFGIISYDSSNGTISVGDIIRTQKVAEMDVSRP